ncbi:hypothetical protein CTI12_AA543370 [Artemisia annua]|uniref:SecA family profile domain-containing protein n=1 Tax=Artemisia annua TaxID=35608 RepID=A0A2U1L0P4_ARTAN|nr:hypothetical protein CTI12_AA543370 [Artemisia annua]
MVGSVIEEEHAFVNDKQHHGISSKDGRGLQHNWKIQHYWKIKTLNSERYHFYCLLFEFCTITVLNAKPENVEREAEIVAQSGCLGAITIATNMAGRGTDIILGGNA